MFKRFTAISRVLMFVSLAVCTFIVIDYIRISAIALDSVPNAIKVSMDNILTVAIVHLMWGLVIEISRNVIKIGEKLGIKSDEINLDDSPWKCAECGNANSSKCRFCQKCGHPKNADVNPGGTAPWKCSQCDSYNPASSAYCMSCGKPKGGN